MRLMKASFGRSKGFLDYARNDIIAAAGRFFDAAFGLAQNDNANATIIHCVWIPIIVNYEF